MKVAIIGSRGIPARYGGFETFAEVLAQGLSKEGYEVIVYSLPEFEKLTFNYPRIKRVFVKTPQIASLEKVYMSSFSAFHSVSKEKAAAIIFLGVSAGLTMWFPKMFSTRTIVNVDGLEWKRSKWNRFLQFSLKTLERLAVRWSDVVVADSEAIGRYVESEYKKNYIFIPYGVDECKYLENDWIEMKNKYQLESGDYYLIVGRHVPENNFDMSIGGFLESKSSKKLVIVSNLTVEDTSPSGNVIFTGGIYDRPKLFALRANAFAYIHGHSVGGTNPSLLEAISSKNIVLAYDVPYNREVLGEYGFYFKDENDLTNFINHWESDFEKIKKENILGYYEQILREKYNWEVVINKYKELLH